MKTDDLSLSQIEKLKRQKQIIENRIQQAESRKKASEKKKDTRRKILLGAFYLDRFTRDGMPDSVKQDLDAFLTRSNDRALFGLSNTVNEPVSCENADASECPA